MNKSETINELASALSKAQAQIKGAVEDSTNPHFRSKYASLQSYIDSAREPLAKNGLAVMQLLTDINCESMNIVSIETIMMHSSGQWISSTFSVPVSKADAQGFGSAVTYARRYSYAAAIGIAPIDDDGNEAVQAAPTKIAKKTNDLPTSVIKGIEDSKSKDDLMNFAAQQTTYHKNTEFRALVAKRKEELNVNA
jgi:hypothetical protein